MTPSEKSYILEGELVRDLWEYEYDDLEIDGTDLKRWVEEQLGPGRVENTSRTTQKTYFGRVRLTLTLLDKGDSDGA